MNTLVGVLIGLVSGWLLFVLTDAWREKRAGLAAARAVFMEIRANLTSLRRMEAVGFWTGAPEGPRRTAYEAHAGSFLLVLNPDAVNALMLAYMEFDKLAWIIKASDPIVFSVEEREEAEFEEYVGLLRDENADPLARAIEIVQEAEYGVSAAAMPRWQRFLVSRAVKRAIRRGVVQPIEVPGDEVASEQALREHIEKLRRAAGRPGTDEETER